MAIGCAPPPPPPPLLLPALSLSLDFSSRESCFSSPSAAYLFYYFMNTAHTRLKRIFKINSPYFFLASSIIWCFALICSPTHTQWTPHHHRPPLTTALLTLTPLFSSPAFLLLIYYCYFILFHQHHHNHHTYLRYATLVKTTFFNLFFEKKTGKNRAPRADDLFLSFLSFILR